MGFGDSVDGYCERVGPGLLAEPANAATNAAFLLAAVIAYLSTPKPVRRDPLIMALCAILALIGLGSLTFHTVATRGAALLDVIPIGLFIHLYVFTALRRFLGWQRGAAVAATFGFFVLGLAVSAAGAGRYGGSVGYVPALAALLAMSAATAVTGTSLARRLAVPARLLAIGGLFAVSLTFRTVDEALCQSFPLGTHFIWHLCNALVLYLLLRLLIELAAAG
jgi:Ceramidase